MKQQVTLTRQAIRTPRAAAVAGIIFSLLFTTSMVLIRLALPEEFRGTDISNLTLWLVLIFPAWVFVISVFILNVSLRGGRVEAEGVIGAKETTHMA